MSAQIPQAAEFIPENWAFETIALQDLPTRSILRMIHLRRPEQEATMALAIALAAAGRRLQVELERILENMGLQDREFRILLTFYVFDPEPVAPADLAFHVGLSRGPLRTALRKLQHAGWVSCQRNRQRRGATNVVLSPRGRKAADTKVAEYLADLGALGSKLGVTEAAAAAVLAQWPFARLLADRNSGCKGAS